MAAKATITAEFPTPREVASRLRIPASRAAELRRQLYALHPENPIALVPRDTPAEKRTKGTAKRTKKK